MIFNLGVRQKIWMLIVSRYTVILQFFFIFIKSVLAWRKNVIVIIVDRILLRQLVSRSWHRNGRVSLVIIEFILRISFKSIRSRINICGTMTSNIHVSVFPGRFRFTPLYERTTVNQCDTVFLDFSQLFRSQCGLRRRFRRYTLQNTHHKHMRIMVM